MSKKISPYYALPAIVLSTLLVLTIVYAWTEPTVAPPGGNVPAPINVGGDTQNKSGALGISGLFETTTETHLAISNGNVGIGTRSPGAKLGVEGDVWIKGNNKLGFGNNPANYYIKSITNGIQFGTYTMGKFTITGGTGEPDFGYWLFTHGRVGIGIDREPGYKLEVEGDIEGTRLCIGGDCRDSWPGGTGGIGGSGANNYIPKWNGDSSLESSGIYEQDSGNVGIGITSHTYKLNVNGRVFSQSFSVLGGSTDLDFTGGSPGTGTPWYGLGIPNVSWDGTFITQLSGFNGILLKTSQGTLAIRKGGNVGIGTTEPDSKLHVIGGICAETSDSGCAPLPGYVRGAGLCIGADCRTSWPAGSALPSGTSGQTLRHNGTNWVANSNIFNNGVNVGIGTGSPGDYRLAIQEVMSFSGAGLLIMNATGGKSMQMWVGGTGGVLDAQGTTNLHLQTNGIDRLFISNATGNVGIGTTGPTIKLAIGDTDTGLNWGGDGKLDLYSNNVFSLSARSGNVGIGTGSPAVTAPNGIQTGNLSANDIYLESTGHWVSEGLRYVGSCWAGVSGGGEFKQSCGPKESSPECVGATIMTLQGFVTGAASTGCRVENQDGDSVKGRFDGPFSAGVGCWFACFAQ